MEHMVPRISPSMELEAEMELDGSTATGNRLACVAS